MYIWCNSWVVSVRIVFVSDSESRLWHVFPGIPLPLAAYRRRKWKAGLGVSAARLGWQRQIPFYLQTLPTHCQLYPSCSRLAQELFLSWFPPHPPTSLCVPAKQNRDYRTELEILPCRRSLPGQSAAACPGPAAPGAQPTLPNTTKHHQTQLIRSFSKKPTPCAALCPNPPSLFDTSKQVLHPVLRTRHATISWVIFSGCSSLHVHTRFFSPPR